MMLSIVTVNFNNSLGLESTIVSVINQTNQDFEYIVIDGGSTDGSVDIINNYSGKISQWVSENDSGIYNAMNKGIARAKGEFLIFLNSGDSFSDNTILERCLNVIKQFPGYSIYYGDMYLANVEGQELRKLRTHPEKLDLKFFKADTINHQASLIRADLFHQFGLYPEQHKVASDYWLYLKSLLNNIRFKHLGFPMVNYDLTGISSINHDMYWKEKNLIWNSLIPDFILETEKELNICKKESEKYRKSLMDLHNYKLTKLAIMLNSKYQNLKTFLQD
jgi:glycosyltransferase involved in cell wall biosynthesis